MVEAVIVDAVRTPIGRALRGSLRAVRADDLAAVALRALVERNPQVDFDETADVMMERRQGRASRATTLGATRCFSPGSTSACPVARSIASARPRCRHCGWRFMRSSPGRGSSTWPPASSRCRGPGSAQRPTTRALNPRLDGSQRLPVRRLHPDGPDSRERCRALRRVARGAGPWAVISQGRAVRRVQSGTSSRDRRGARFRLTREDDGEGGTLELPETVVTPTTGRAPVRRWRCWRRRAGLQARRHGDRRQLLPAQRRRRSGAGDERARAERLGLRPRARILASSVAAVEPEYMGVGPIPAIRSAARATGRSIAQIDIVEINEAFAAQVVPCMRELAITDGAAQPVRRRDRARSPVRHDRRADHDGAAQRTRDDRRGGSGSRPCAWPAAWGRRCWWSGSSVGAAPPGGARLPQASARLASDSANHSFSSVCQAASARPAAASSAATRSRVNLALISVRSSSPAAKLTVRPIAGSCASCASPCAQPHLDPLVVGVEERRRDRKAEGSKLAPSSRLRTCRTLRLNSAVTPSASS